MAKHIVKVDKGNNAFRINIPRGIILTKRWHDTSYVVVEDDWGDKLLIRRFVDDQALKTED